MFNNSKEVAAFGVFMYFILMIMGVIAYIDLSHHRMIQDGEKYNAVYSTLNDEQKRKADSLPPVCSESEYDKFLCKERIELLEAAHASGADIPQSDPNGGGSLSFGVKIDWKYKRS